MDDNRDLEQDYIRRLRFAQESGDTQHVPLVDETRVRSGKSLTTKEAIQNALTLWKRPDAHLGGVER